MFPIAGGILFSCPSYSHQLVSFYHLPTIHLISFMRLRLSNCLMTVAQFIALYGLLSILPRKDSGGEFRTIVGDRRERDQLGEDRRRVRASLGHRHWSHRVTATGARSS